MHSYSVSNSSITFKTICFNSFMFCFVWLFGKINLSFYYTSPIYSLLNDLWILPESAFGSLTIHSLALVDTFGQYKFREKLCSLFFDNHLIFPLILLLYDWSDKAHDEVCFGRRHSSQWFQKGWIHSDLLFYVIFPLLFETVLRFLITKHNANHRWDLIQTQDDILCCSYKFYNTVTKVLF